MLADPLYAAEQSALLQQLIAAYNGPTTAIRNVDVEVIELRDRR